VRLRPIAALSAAAASALLLAGCAGLGGDVEPEPTSTDAAASLCDAIAAPGDASDAVTVDGEPGTPATPAFSTPLEIPELQVSVLDAGTGAPVEAGDFINYAMTAIDPETGEEIITIGYEPGELMPSQISAGTMLGQVLGCNAPGARVVAAFPESDTANAEVYVIDLLSVAPAAASGAPQDPVAGMPAVTLDEAGAPAIAVPDADAPTETTLATLKQGDGYEVQDGDYVLIQYTGVRWSDGETFDTTWDDGVPIAYPTTTYVAGFQKALVGHTVGSQVLVVIPPVDGYGEGEINADDLKGETLVFVVDLLGAQHVPAAQ